VLRGFAPPPDRATGDGTHNPDVPRYRFDTSTAARDRDGGADRVSRRVLEGRASGIDAVSLAIARVPALAPLGVTVTMGAALCGAERRCAARYSSVPCLRLAGVRTSAPNAKALGDRVAASVMNPRSGLWKSNRVSVRAAQVSNVCSVGD
jgi:hypothetical protein